MLTADPRIVPTAVPVASVTFEEASELAYFGAKILHPISMQPAMAYNIPVSRCFSLVVSFPQSPWDCGLIISFSIIPIVLGAFSFCSYSNC
jgi:hypothetical protein